jgi:hypothetical protein
MLEGFDSFLELNLVERGVFLLFDKFSFLEPEFITEV